MSNDIQLDGRTPNYSPSARLINSLRYYLRQSNFQNFIAGNVEFILDSQQAFHLRTSKKLGSTGLKKIGNAILLVDEDCCICCELIGENADRLPCNHYFHYQCVISWFQQNNTCPLCRIDLDII